MDKSTQLHQVDVNVKVRLGEKIGDTVDIVPLLFFSLFFSCCLLLFFICMWMFFFLFSEHT